MDRIHRRFVFVAVAGVFVLLLLLFVLPVCLPSAIRLWNSVPATL